MSSGPRAEPRLAFRLSPHLTVMVNAAQKASKRLLRDFNEVEQLQVSVKGPSDFVSQADLRAEETLREELNKARPGYAFLMEESGASGSENWAWRWVVDPLDGTTNFLHGIPHWAISIGLERRMPDGGAELAAGLIYAPAVDEMFWAEKGGGAFVNEKRLRVSARREFKDGVFATGIPFAAVSRTRQTAFLRTLARLMPQVAGIRRFGAAALDLAWVAAGRYDGYWELGISRWDMAAGLIIVREAGDSPPIPMEATQARRATSSPPTRISMPSCAKWCLRNGGNGLVVADLAYPLGVRLLRCRRRPTQSWYLSLAVSDSRDTSPAIFCCPAKRSGGRRNDEDIDLPPAPTRLDQGRGGKAGGLRRHKSEPVRRHRRGGRDRRVAHRQLFRGTPRPANWVAFNRLMARDGGVPPRAGDELPEEGD